MDEENLSGIYKPQSIFTPASAQSNLELLSRIKFRFFGFYRSLSQREWNTNGIEPACHYYHHIHFVRGGAGRVYGAGTEMRLQPGFAYWTPSNAPLARECDHYFSEYFLLLRCELIDGVDIFTGWPDLKPVLLGPWDKHEWNREWRKTPASINFYMQLQGILFQLMAQSFGDLNQIIVHHLHLCGNYAGVFELIEKRLGADLLISEMAKAHGTSLAAFSMAFRRDLGVSAKTYLNRRLNQEACHLVLTTQYSVKEIAARLRFADEHYFSRFFSKMNGTPPVKYRQTFLTKKQRIL